MDGAGFFGSTALGTGGVGAPDTCDEVDTASRVTVIESRNIGKRSLQLLNCVVSQNPSYQYYGSGRQECLWSSGPFRGWIPDSVGGATSEGYGSVIGRIGL